MTDREKLLDIKNQIIAHLDKETKPIEEPVEEKPSTPISNLVAEIGAGNHVILSWTAHQDGDMDIVYDRPQDSPWKHSVLKYRGRHTKIESERDTIGFNSPIETARFKVVIGDWESPIVGVDSSKPKPEPTPEPKPEEPKPEPTPEPIEEPTNPDSVVQVAVTFLKGKSIDAWVNGIKLQDDFDYTFSVPSDYNAVNNQAGVKIIGLSEPFKTFVFDKEQSHTSVKVVNRDPDNDLTKIDSRHDNTNPNFWGTPALNNHPLGIIYSAKGDTIERDKPYPDPLFYKGWREDPINRPNDRDFHPQWSATGKIVISFLD